MYLCICVCILSERFNQFVQLYEVCDFVRFTFVASQMIPLITFSVLKVTKQCWLLWRFYFCTLWIFMYPFRKLHLSNDCDWIEEIDIIVSRKFTIGSKLFNKFTYLLAKSSDSLHAVLFWSTFFREKKWNSFEWI